jgi:hypothetical protein
MKHMHTTLGMPAQEYNINYISFTLRNGLLIEKKFV